MSPAISTSSSDIFFIKIRSTIKVHVWVGDQQLSKAYPPVPQLKQCTLLVVSSTCVRDWIWCIFVERVMSTNFVSSRNDEAIAYFFMWSSSFVLKSCSWTFKGARRRWYQNGADVVKDMWDFISSYPHLSSMTSAAAPPLWVPHVADAVMGSGIVPVLFLFLRFLLVFRDE